MKNIISTFVLSFYLIIGIANAQDITNTLAPNGSFKIKDGTTDYLSLSQTTGNLTLYKNLELNGNENDSTTIVIKINGQRYMHNFRKSGTDGYNTFIGLSAGNFSLIGFYDQASYNTAVGFEALTSLTNGSYNSAFGYNSLSSNTVGSNNSAFGIGSLSSNISGSENSAYGVKSLNINSEGFQNSSFGVESQSKNTIGFRNSSFGYRALYSSVSGNYNSAFGYASLTQNTTGNFNSAFGSSSLLYNSTGYQNVGIGTESLFNNTTGNKNTAVGHRSLYTNTTGFQNTAVGDSALYGNRWGNYNTAIGYNAGSIVLDGANLTLIGTDANPSSSNAIDQITLGNQFVSSLRCNVQTITSLSDARDKKNIQDLILGLDFITKLKPRQFNWDRRDWYEGGKSDGSKTQEGPTAGFIAQEFDEIQKSENAEWLNLVLKDNPDKWEATYGNLLPVIVKAVQELAIKNEQLKIENEKLIERLLKFKEVQTILANKIEQIESSEQLLKVQLVNSENNNQ